MRNREEAVSPVIGVMLMLVVVIIIAALVSAFSGSAVSGTEKSSMATVQASYSQSRGMTISHAGGDAIPLDATTIMVRPSKTFGADATRYSWAIDKHFVMSTEHMTWADTKAFRPGDAASISVANLTYVQERADGTVGDASLESYGFANPKNIGLSFELQFLDTGGKAISQSAVTIIP